MVLFSPLAHAILHDARDAFPYQNYGYCLAHSGAFLRMTRDCTKMASLEHDDSCRCCCA